MDAWSCRCASCDPVCSHALPARVSAMAFYKGNEVLVSLHVFYFFSINKICSSSFLFINHSHFDC